MRHLILDFTSPKEFIILWGFWNLETMHTVNINGDNISQVLFTMVKDADFK